MFGNFGGIFCSGVIEGLVQGIPSLRREASSRGGYGRSCKLLIIYLKSNVAERCANQCTQWRPLATRYEKRAAT
jgi:hypothetical protein